MGPLDAREKALVLWFPLPRAERLRACDEWWGGTSMRERVGVVVLVNTHRFHFYSRKRKPQRSCNCCPHTLVSLGVAVQPLLMHVVPKAVASVWKHIIIMPVLQRGGVNCGSHCESCDKEVKRL